MRLDHGRVLGAEPSWKILECLTQIIAQRPRLELIQDVVVNCVVLQARVNPAFRYVFWFALEHRLRLHEGMAPLSELTAPMMFDLMAHWDARASRSDVRRAQVAFMASLGAWSADEVARWNQSDEASWTERCRGLFEAAPLEHVWHEISLALRREAIELRADAAKAARRAFAMVGLSSHVVQLGDLQMDLPLEWPTNESRGAVVELALPGGAVVSFRFNGTMGLQPHVKRLAASLGQPRIEASKLGARDAQLFAFERDGERLVGALIVGSPTTFHEYLATLSGPASAVTEHEPAFQAMLETVR